MKTLSDYIGAIPLGSNGATVLSVDLSSDGKKISGFCTTLGYLDYESVIDDELLELKPDAVFLPLRPVAVPLDTLLTDERGRALGRIKDAAVMKGTIKSYLIERPYKTAGVTFEISDGHTTVRKIHKSETEKHDVEATEHHGVSIETSAIAAELSRGGDTEFLTITAQDGSPADKSIAEDNRATTQETKGDAIEKTKTAADRRPPVNADGAVAERLTRLKTGGDETAATLSGNSERTRNEPCLQEEEIPSASETNAYQTLQAVLFSSENQTKTIPSASDLDSPDCVPSRIISDYSFLLGRVVTDDITADGKTIIPRGELILTKTVGTARCHYKLLDLTVKSKS